MSQINDENWEPDSIRIVRTWKMNKEKNTIVFTIPRILAKKYHLDSPTNMLAIPTNDGILIKKLEMDGIR